MPCRMAAACSAGNASRSRNDVMSWVQTKNGIRNHVMPGARSWTMVVMKFTAPRSDEKISSSIPTSHHVCPCGAKSASGGRTSSLFAAPPGTKKLASITSPPASVEPVAGEVEAWKRHVWRADLERHDVVPECAHG